jgi:endo-1,4-beta-xylanase
MNYDILITEFDVNDQWLPRDIEVRDRVVADCGRAYLELMFGYPRLKDMLVWGMCDKSSWLQRFPPLRADGAPKRLRGAIAAALAGAAVRS